MYSSISVRFGTYTYKPKAIAVQLAVSYLPVLTQPGKNNKSCHAEVMATADNMIRILTQRDYCYVMFQKNIYMQIEGLHLQRNIYLCIVVVIVVRRLMQY